MGSTDKETMDHKAVIWERDNPSYPFEVLCACSWQALTKTREQAEYYKRHHESNALWIQATRGWQRGH